MILFSKSVKEAQLDDSSVTTDKLKAGAVTNVKNRKQYNKNG